MKTDHNILNIGLLLFIIILVLIINPRNKKPTPTAVPSLTDYQQTGGVCFLGLGDCGTETTSSVENINNQKIITKNSFDQLNKQVNTAIAESIVQNATKTSSMVSNQQEIDIQGGIRASGPGSSIDLTGKLSQQATVDLSSINITNATNQAAGSFANTALTWVKNNNSSDILTQMEAAASAAAKSGFLATAPATSNSSVINKNDITVDTSNFQNISNILQNQIQNNFTTGTVQDAIASVQQRQKASITGGIIAEKGGVITSDLSQSQTASSIATSKSVVDVTTKILNNTLQSCGVTIDQSNEMTSKTTQAGTTTATAKNEGPIDAIGNIFSGMFSGMTGIIVIIIIIIIIVIAGGGLFFYYSSQK